MERGSRPANAKRPWSGRPSWQAPAMNPPEALQGRVLFRAGMAACLAVSLITAGCSGSRTDRVAKIAVVVPLRAGLVQFGQGIRNSVRLAIDEANRRRALPGWRFRLAAEDDSSNPA